MFASAWMTAEEFTSPQTGSSREIRPPRSPRRRVHGPRTPLRNSRAHRVPLRRRRRTKRSAVRAVFASADGLFRPTFPAGALGTRGADRKPSAVAESGTERRQVSDEAVWKTRATLGSAGVIVQRTVGCGPASGCARLRRVTGGPRRAHGRATATCRRERPQLTSSSARRAAASSLRL